MQSAVVTFYTAWAPSEPLIDKMSELFPTLTFTLKYYEGGMGFKGTYKVKNKKILTDMSGDYTGTRGG